MPIYRTNGTAETGGQTIGVLCLDEHLPFIPGDINNASSHPYPVKYKRVPGMHSVDVMAGNHEFLPRLLQCARELESEGVRGIITNCGYLLQFQQQLAEAVKVPVAASSLLQIPLVAASLAPDQTIGIMAAAVPLLSADFIRNSGIEVSNPLAIYGMQDEPGVKQLLQACGVGDDHGHSRAGLMTLDTEMVADDMVRIARRLLAEHPDTGAIIFECTGFPPYAKAVQQATGLPVFDALTLAQLLFGVTHPKHYQGYM